MLGIRQQPVKLPEPACKRAGVYIGDLRLQPYSDRATPNRKRDFRAAFQSRRRIEKPAPDAETVRRLPLPDAVVVDDFPERAFQFRICNCGRIECVSDAISTDFSPNCGNPQLEMHTHGHDFGLELRGHTWTWGSCRCSGDQIEERCCPTLGQVIRLQIGPRRVGPASLTSRLRGTLTTGACPLAVVLETRSRDAETNLDRLPALPAFSSLWQWRGFLEFTAKLPTLASNLEISADARHG